MRRFLIVIGVIVAITIAGSAIFVSTFNVNRYHGAIQSQLEQRLDRKVTLGDMRLNLFPPRFSVQNLSIAEDSGFGTEKPFVQTQLLDVSVKLLLLLKGAPEINSLTLQRPSVELIKNQQGVWNFSSLAGPLVSGGPSVPSDHASQQFSLVNLAISDGQVAVTDLQSKTSRAVYDHIDLTLLNFAPNAPLFHQRCRSPAGPRNATGPASGASGTNRAGSTRFDAFPRDS